MDSRPSEPSQTADRDDFARCLLLATERLAEREQPAKITVRKIAEEAGVATGLLYSYFPSKDAVILATLKSMALDMEGVLQEVTGIEGTIAEGTRFLINRPGFPRLIAWVILQGGNLAELKDDPVLVRLKSDFADLGFPDPEIHAGAVSSMLLGNALFQAGINSAIESDPNDERLSQELNQTVLDYAAKHSY
jgi:AcrR family transcriptional regulator